MEEKDFIEYYRKIVEEGTETTHNSHLIENQMASDIDEVWSNVSFELDIDEVWNNVSEKLNDEKRRKKIRLVIAWSSAAVIFFLVGLFIFENESVENKQSAQIVTSEQIIKKSNDYKSLNTSNSKPKSKIDNNISSNGTSIISSTNNVDYQKDNKKGNGDKVIDTLTQKRIVESEEKKIPDKNSDRMESTNLAILDSKETIRLTQTSLTEKVIPELMFSETEITSNPQRYLMKNRFSIGISNAIKNTWLINNETKEGFNKNSLKTTKPQFIPDLGIIIKYAFTNKWSAEVSGFFSSSIGQSYSDYVYGDYRSKNITLRYASFEGVVRYLNYRPKSLNNISFNSIVGLYFSRLRSANQTIGGDKKSVYNQYHNIDYGFVFGQEMELFIFNRISIAPSLCIKVGIPNVYRGYSEIPSSLHKTQNGSVDFRLSVYYKLFK